MFRAIDSILIGSEDAKKLAEFYKKTVGLKAGEEMVNDESGDEGYNLELPEGPGLYILDHSEVKGKNTTPARVMVNLEVDDAEKEVERLKKAGVKQIAELYHIPGYGLVSTFEDPDGNYFQVVQVRDSE